MEALQQTYAAKTQRIAERIGGGRERSLFELACSAVGAQDSLTEPVSEIDEFESRYPVVEKSVMSNCLTLTASDRVVVMFGTLFGISMRRAAEKDATLDEEVLRHGHGGSDPE